MELRPLTTEKQKQVFGEHLARARASLGMRFKEKSRSQLAKIQLAFADLYGLFEEEDDPDERMIAGLAMHDLEMFPQTCSRPDLSHLPPRSVLEISDFWSLSKGAGMLVWCGAAVQTNRQRPRAVLVYMVTGPVERTDSYVAAGFVKTGAPFVYPYLETMDGQDVYVQPLIIEGARMQRLTKVLSRMTASAAAEDGAIRMRDFLGIKRPSLECSTSLPGARTVRDHPTAARGLAEVSTYTHATM